MKSAITILIALFLLATTQLFAAIISVDNNCSLTDAITAANNDSATGGCPAGSGLDNIILQQDSTITISVPWQTGIGLPNITSEINILGFGAIIERSDAVATPAFRLFKVNGDASLTLANLTVRNGQADSFPGGGGIDNQGSLLLSNVTMAENAATSISNPGGGGGGIENSSSGVLTVIDSTFRDNTAEIRGAAILNWGSLIIQNSSFLSNISMGTGGAVTSIGNSSNTVSDSVFENNRAATDGGAIYTTAPIIITNSTFSGNQGGPSGNGGAIFGFGGLTLVNSTLSGNSTGWVGGGLYLADAGSLVNSTITNNTGNLGGNGIWVSTSTTLTITNSIVAGNGSKDCTGSSAIQDDGNNWFGDDSCNGTADGDPLLSPLADNGGPSQTHALLPGSGAINTANNTVCNSAPVNGTDQRGEPRPEPSGSQCDIGAFELQSVASTYSVGGTVDGLTGTGLVLQNNAGDDLSIDSAGDFTFVTELNNGEAYSVTVLTQPVTSNQVCSISNGTGSIAGENVGDIAVICQQQLIFNDSFE